VQSGGEVLNCELDDKTFIDYFIVGKFVEEDFDDGKLGFRPPLDGFEFPLDVLVFNDYLIFLEAFVKGEGRLLWHLEEVGSRSRERRETAYLGEFVLGNYLFD